jgi:hypothetical protein
MTEDNIHLNRHYRLALKVFKDEKFETLCQSFHFLEKTGILTSLEKFRLYSHFCSQKPLEDRHRDFWLEDSYVQGGNFWWKVRSDNINATDFENKKIRAISRRCRMSFLRRMIKITNTNIS